MSKAKPKPIRYRVRSGDLDGRIERPFQAQATTLVITAVEAALAHGVRLGRLIEVKGGQYSGPQRVYFESESVLQSMGVMEGADRRDTSTAAMPHD